jgi:hypothetical protein
MRSGSASISPRLRNTRLEGFSVEWLMTLLNALGQDAGCKSLWWVAALAPDPPHAVNMRLQVR